MNSQHPAGRLPVERIGDRYEVRGVIGRGGMGVVYRASDLTGGREVALKQLVLPHDPGLHRDAQLLFEREFHTLSELSHPRVIEVYDYGLDPAGPFYTMELLDGGDLRARSPLPWREACALLLDVCSSLALLHSRRLVHRDISPRNIRITRDGSAKLIDFGALCPMGGGARIVGTPPFVAPEVVHRLAVDARTDLFSLGATLYFALTRRVPYPAREFAELPEVWAKKPPLPSAIVADVPPALDALVMSLISVEPALRPRTAFEVMERLAALAEVERPEPRGALQAHLATPLLVGRDAARAAVRERLAAAQAGRGGAVSIAGEAGVGRTRMLDACVLEAKTLGATVLHVSGGALRGVPFGAARELAEQLLDALPEDALTHAHADEAVEQELFGGQVDGRRPQLRSFAQPDLAAARPQAAMTRWFTQLARARLLVIAVDDVQSIDEASAVLLASLAQRASDLRLSLLLSMPREHAAPSRALRMLLNACAEVELRPLDAEETDALLESVFGDVRNLALVSARIFAIARGNPRESMALAQHLIDRGLCSYANGVFALPSALDAADLPASGDQAFRERVAALSPLARKLVETQALSAHEAFTRYDYAVLSPDIAAGQVDAALSELLARQVLLSDGERYTLARPDCARILAADVEPGELEARHRALARLYEQAATHELSALHHWLEGGCSEEALDRLAPGLEQAEKRDDLLTNLELAPDKIVQLFERALAASEALGRPPRERHQIRQMLTALSILTDDAAYHRHAPVWRAQLEQDSGLSLYETLDRALPAGERLKQAFEAAFARYLATDERERVYRPDEAITMLVRYVVFSIAIGARTADAPLLGSLPRLLEPFAPLSPLVDAMWQNAIATFEVNCLCLAEQARARTLDILARLEKVTEAELRHVDTIRAALSFCVGAIETGLGMGTALDWADRLDRDVLQKVNAMHIRKAVHLQQGDAEAAERFRREAELLAAAANSRQMFTSVLSLDLGIYAFAGDLSALRQVMDEIDPLADRCPGWEPLRQVAQGHFERLRGDPEKALLAYERCLALCTPDARSVPRTWRTWPRAVASTLEVLIDLGRSEEARARGATALALGRAHGMGLVLVDIERALALAEARLGDHAGACARLDRVIAQQRALGILGANLGASYEARAQVAIWAGDRAAFESYGRLTAIEYRHGHGSPFGARYERLMLEAQRAGVVAAPEHHERDAIPPASDEVTLSEAVTRNARGTMRTTSSRRTRRN